MPLECNKKDFENRSMGVISFFVTHILFMWRRFSVITVSEPISKILFPPESFAL